MEKTVESKVAETILEQHQKIQIGSQVFNVSPPTTATLIQVSNLISKLPAIRLNQDNLVYESLMIAKNCEILGVIASTLVLGVPKYTNIPPSIKSRLKRLILRKSVCDANRYEDLGKTILTTMSPSELNQLIVKLLQSMEIADFFGLTTSLLEVNLLRTSREVV